VGVVLLVGVDAVVDAGAALVAVETAVVRDPAEGEPSATAAPANIPSDTIVAAKAAVQEAKWRRIARKVNQSTIRTKPHGAAGARGPGQAGRPQHGRDHQP
jgi:hypothetical protein